MTDRLIIFDTTLRDGEQSPGASMTRDEKLRIARQLERLRVDVIEAGFPAASNGDFEAVRAIAGVDQGLARCAGLCRANDRDIARGIEALQGAKSLAHPHLHRDQRAPHGEEAAHDAASRCSSRRGWRCSFARNHCPRRRVLARGRPAARTSTSSAASSRR